MFEKVSPVYKGGAGAGQIEAVAENGESVAYYAPTAFEGAPIGLTQNIDSLDYLSRRGATKWVTEPIMPPPTLMPVAVGEYRDVSPNMDVTLALGNPGRNVENALQEGTETEFILHETGLPDVSSDWSLVDEPMKLLNHEPTSLEYLGGDQNFCHLLFHESTENVTRTGGHVLLAGAEGTKPQLYELARGCDGEPGGLRLVGVKNSGEVVSPGCQVDLGIQSLGETSHALKAFNAVANDGKMIFFTTCVENNEPNHQLFARLGGSHTVEVSKPLAETCGEEIPCPQASKRASANFAGASEDGSKVFFTTTAPLDSNTDTDDGNDLYMATIGCPAGEGCGVSERRVTAMAQVSQDPNGGEARVQGVVRVAPNGARVYFVAQGNLLSATAQQALEGEGRPVPQVGADNMYEYENVSKETEFIGDLCFGHDVSGLVEDRHCPSETGTDTELWLNPEGEIEAQTAGVDGRYLLFSSYGQLTSDDTDAARDVYRFDAVTGVLERVSDGEEGFDADGNGDGLNASILASRLGGGVRLQHEMGTRAMSENGSRIIFEATSPLSPGATNGLVNVYEWHENPGGVGGSVSLLSGGSSSTPVEDAVISPGGGDVFFITSQGLVPQDTDGAPDIYDARLDGGFAPVPAVSEPCSGDACQGPLTNPAPLLVPSSVSQSPGENLTSSGKPATLKKAAKEPAKCRRGYKRNKRRKCAKAKRAARKAAVGSRARKNSSRGGRS